MATTVAKINTILSKKYGVEISLSNDIVFVEHPSDINAKDRILKNGGSVVGYIAKYEPFEIRSKNKVYSHILIDTLDTTDSNILTFESDMDLNNQIQVMGSTKGKELKYNGVYGYFRRQIILDYKSIDSIEYISFIPRT